MRRSIVLTCWPTAALDRNLSYVALTRHRHQLAFYVDQESFASGDQLRRVLAREPRKDLVRDYRDAGAPDLTPELPSEQALADSWMPSVEPAPRELTPERNLNGYSSLSVSSTNGTRFRAGPKRPRKPATDYRTTAACWLSIRRSAP